MSDPKLSVLMTVYNGARHVGQAVESILSQTFTEYEFLITDDGSTDGTFQILSNFASRDRRIKLSRNEKNLNITRTMNRLFGLAQGQYVTRHDGDDISTPERFACQIGFLDESPEIGLVASQVQVIDDVGLPVDIEMFSGPSDNESIQKDLTRRNCLCQGSVIFRRELLTSVGLYDIEVDHSEDFDLWLRMAEVTQFAKLPERLYSYRRHSSSISQTFHGATVSRGAVALERAYERRIASQVHVPDPKVIAAAFASAIESCAAVGAMPRMVESIIGTLKFDSELLFSDSLRIPIQPTNDGLRLVDMIFNGLPHTSFYASLRSRLLGRIYMREAFEALVTRDWPRIDGHLWTGLRYDSKWLLNRGVLVIILKTLAWRLNRLRRPA